jgi:DNA-directed RNA polymerase specialized sigma24 family protein
MGDTEEPIRRPEPSAEWLAPCTLRDTYYRPLVRLAALLTGDADAAEAVASEALAGLRSASPLEPEVSADVLRYLQQRVLVRSRRSRRPAISAGRIRQARRGTEPSVTKRAPGPPVPAQPSAADFARLPVVRALQDLPRRGREAIVLTHYLDLSEQQAALVAGVTPAALRRFLSEAMRALDHGPPDA